MHKLTLLLLTLLSFSTALAEPEKKDEPAPIVTEHTVKIDGQDIKYKATAGRLPLKDDSGKVKAWIFHIAYERLDATDKSKRPITFAFNGGPGSSSVWLHMGALGPRRVEFGKDGEPLPPPAKVIDNDLSWLDFTDLVFIDPVSTGYSRAAEGENASQFHGLDEDVRAVGEFIRSYTTQSQRWLSPKYLAGESYGTTRASAMSDFLQGSYGMYINGIVLISPVLDFQTLQFNRGNDLPYWVYLPTYTATAWYHKKLAADLQKDLPKTLAEVEKFAQGDYLLALAKGDTLPDSERTAIAEKLARYTGLSKEFITRVDLRVTQGEFCKELLRADSRTVGRLDSRYKGIDRDDAGRDSDYDPSYAVIQGPYTAALNAYIREELGFKSDLNYEILTGLGWNMGSGPGGGGGRSGYPRVSDSLRHAITANPSLKVLVCNGYYDMATPYFASDFTFAHLGLDATLRANISTARFEAGHMMYVRLQDMKTLRDAAAKLIK